MMLVGGACWQDMRAATIEWTNTAGGNWNVAQNWSPNVVPSSPDIAVITNDGTYTVSLNVTPNISGLILGGSSGTQTLATAPGGLTVNGGAVIGPNGQLNYSAGTLTVTNGLKLQGVMLWSGGQLPATTKLTVESNALLSLTGARQLFGAITNSGTISNSSFSGSGILHNLSSGLIILSQPSGQGFGGSLLVNDGTVRTVSPVFSAGLGATTFINNGVIDAQAGTLILTGARINDGSSYIGSGTNSLNGGTLNGAFTSENLRFPGATLGGTGTLHGSMVWSGGTIGAALIIASNATLVVAGSPHSLSGTITNAGTIQLVSGGISPTPVGILHILPNALLDAQPPGIGNLSISGGLFVNDGTIRKSVGTGNLTIGGTFFNNGTMDAQTGTISLSSPSFGGPMLVLSEGSRYIGAGTNRLNGYVNLAGAVTSENLVGDTSYLQGNGTLHGSMLFKGNSSIVPGGGLTIATNGTLTVATRFFIAGSLTNAGTVAWEVSPGIIGSGTLHNLASGLLDLKDNSALIASENPRLINDGVFRKSAGTGTNTIPAGLPFINNGTILAQSGTLLFSGSLTNPAGTLAVDGGKIQSTTPLVIPGGQLTGSGTIEAPSITSAALVDPGATNAVLILSGSYTQQLAGSMQFDLGGSDPGVNQSQVIVTGSAHLTGTVGVRFSPGYTSAIGTDYPVLEAASLTGNFKCFDGFLLLGQNKRLSAFYSPTNLVLTTIAAPDPTGPSLNIATDGRVLVCWPSEFTGYGLYSNTNLNGGDWTLAPGATNRHLELPLVPQKFFRLDQQP